jgi:hypothetical protein
MGEGEGEGREERRGEERRGEERRGEERRGEERREEKRREEKRREEKRREEKRREEKRASIKNWFSTSPWLSTLLPFILGPLAGMFLLISFGPWALNRLTNFVNCQIDNLAAKPVQIDDHKLAMEDQEI